MAARGFVLLFVTWQSAHLVFGQVPSSPEQTAITAAAMVKLNFPEQVELKLLIDYVSQRLGVKILYDEQVANKKITIKAPQEIPAQSLMGLLESSLKMKGLALVDASTPGWKRIVATTDLSQIAKPQNGQPLGEMAATAAVTQAFELKHIDPQQLSQIIKPFLTQPGANTINVPGQNVLIVTDYADNLVKLTQLIEAVDRAGPETVVQFYKAQNVEAATLAQQLTQALATRPALQGQSRADIHPDERTNQLIIVATRAQIDEVLELAKALDVPLGVTTQTYSFRSVDAARIDKLVKELFDPLTVKRLYHSAVDQDANLLVATTTPEIHQKIEWLRQQMDQEANRPGSAVKFYKLKHASAPEVLATIQSVEQSQQQGRPDFQRGVSSLGRGRTGGGRFQGGAFSNNGSQNQTVPGPNTPGTPGQPPVATPALREAGSPIQQMSYVGTTPNDTSGIVPGAAHVTADQSSNTIIVVADRPTQQAYADLIGYLDRRRPQVMIEAKVVILDTSDGFSFGVQLSALRNIGTTKVLQFTQFGLGAVDPVSGALALTPGSGVNWALVNPEDADAVLRALANHRRARVLSAPQILVNDNATGTLASVQEVPFTSVNASNTVATTSFAGFAEAGTTIEVTPRISDDDNLQLDYTVSLNSFTGEGSAGVPPPRQTDEVTSSVTIPDGYTVIAGGLNRRSTSNSYNGLPFIENVPVMKHLLGQTTKSDSQTTSFVFLKPTILRDDKFQDLKYLSDRNLDASCSPGNYPRSEPLLMR
jgi:type II secretory pathway component GspD/PulD (secretin)